MTDLGEVTRLLREVERGEPGATDRLFSLVYGELRRRASRELARLRLEGSLQTTMLVNEGYLRLFGPGNEQTWSCRRHFYYAAARAMHDAIVDHLRRREAQKRGGNRNRVAIDPEQLKASDPGRDILDVSAALEELRQHDEACADIVLLRFFGGLTYEQIADVTHSKPGRVRQGWDYAQAWLSRRLGR